MLFNGMNGEMLSYEDLAFFVGSEVKKDCSDIPGGILAVCNALTSAIAYVNGYTGLSLDRETVLQYPDLAHAVLTVGAEMLDNRQMTAEYTAQNPMVMQILNMHSTNLLPSVPDETGAL